MIEPTQRRFSNKFSWGPEAETRGAFCASDTGFPNIAKRLASCFFALAVSCFSNTKPAAAQNPFGELLDAVGNVFGVDNDRPAGRAMAFPNRRVQPATAEFDNIKVKPEFQNHFTMQLRKQLTPELHFVKKVCEPSDAEFDAIHRHGLMTVAKMSKLYESLERAGKSAHEWPQPRTLLAKELTAIVGETMSTKTSETYKAEMDARDELFVDASCGVMIAAMDKELRFSPDQFDSIDLHLKENWKESWSRSLNMLAYFQYMELPDSRTMKDLLTDEQKHVWSTRTNHGRIHFGWQNELGGQDWFGGGAALPEFDLPKGVDKAKAQEVDQLGGMIMMQVDADVLAVEEVEVAEEMIEEYEALIAEVEDDGEGKNVEAVKPETTE